MWLGTPKVQAIRSRKILYYRAPGLSSVHSFKYIIAFNFIDFITRFTSLLASIESWHYDLDAMLPTLSELDSDAGMLLPPSMQSYICG